MADKFNAKDALADYVTVPQRIAQFYELFGQGRLVTGEVRVELGPDGKSRVMVQAAAYRTPDDPLPGIGWSWMELPGTTSFTRGSELENTETSAWGRAIAALGILVDRSVATSTEIAAKKDERVTPPVMHREEITGLLSIGTSNQSDGNLRETPDGWALGFNLTTGPRAWVRVLLLDELALALAGLNVQLRPGLPLKVFGVVEKAEDHVGDRIIRYQRVTAEKVIADDWELPVPGQTGPGLFDAATERELDGLL
jgi:hypothetical protein